MPEPIDPREAPFAALRLPAVPLAPRPAFATELRVRLEQAVHALHPTDPEEAPTVSTTSTATTSTTATTAASTPSDTAATAASPLSPYLAVAGAARAIDWYRDVLGAVETTRFVGDDGRVGHAELVVGGARIMLADEFPEMGVHGPRHYGGTSVLLHLEVADVDHTYRRAVDAGAEPQRPPSDQGHGNRNATIVDPFGHRWMLSQPIAPERAADARDEPGDPAGSGEWQITGRAPVEPGYLTIHTADRARSAAFYGALFGWRVEGGSQGGHVPNTRFPLGFAEDPSADADRTGAGTGPRTTVYFRVDDIEPYAQKVVELGGRVERREQYPSGDSATCVDDQGYRFELWRAAPGY